MEKKVEDMRRELVEHLTQPTVSVRESQVVVIENPLSEREILWAKLSGVIKRVPSPERSMMIEEILTKLKHF